MKRKEQKEQTRKKIYETAITLFILKGYDYVSVDEIVKEAQVSKGAFYHHFFSKKAILIDYGNSIHESLIGAVNQIAGRNSPNIIEQIHIFIDCMIDFTITNYEGLRMLLEQSSKAGNTELGFVSISNEIIFLLSGVLERGRRSNLLLFHVNSYQLSEYLVTLFYNISNHTILHTPQESYSNKIRESVSGLKDLFLYGILPRSLE